MNNRSFTAHLRLGRRGRISGCVGREVFRQSYTNGSERMIARRRWGDLSMSTHSDGALAITPIGRPLEQDL